jgi:hypothetical protein
MVQDGVDDHDHDHRADHNPHHLKRDGADAERGRDAWQEFFFSSDDRQERERNGEQAQRDRRNGKSLTPGVASRALLGSYGGLDFKPLGTGYHTVLDPVSGLDNYLVDRRTCGRRSKPEGRERPSLAFLRA